MKGLVFCLAIVAALCAVMPCEATACNPNFGVSSFGGNGFYASDFVVSPRFVQRAEFIDARDFRAFDVVPVGHHRRVIRGSAVVAPGVDVRIGPLGRVRRVRVF